MPTIRNILLTTISMVALLPSAFATEGGTQSAPGPESWAAGVVPPRGFYYLNYLGGYTGQLKGGSGDKVQINGTTPSVDAVVNVSRFLYVTPLKLFGADVAIHAIVPVAFQNVDLGGAKSITSVGDVEFDPFVLAWHRPTVHYLTGLEFFAPTGHYNKSDSRSSVGANYWSVEPIFAISYLPKSGYELSTKFMWNFKTTNDATNYHSGDEFHFDYLVGKRFGSTGVGMCGYLVKQFTDDTVNGVTVPASDGVWSTGRRGQVVALGPSLTYTSKKGVSFVLQWQHETLVRNRFGGDKFWFKVILPENALVGKTRS